MPIGGGLSRSPVRTLNGAVASAVPLAASAGVHVLKGGGNAFDAAVAVAAVEGVCNPGMCGLGGEAFALLYEARTSKVYGLVSVGAAAQKATPEWFQSQGHNTIPAWGPLSAALPGELAALEAILRRFGTRPMSELLEPAVRYAEKGVALSDQVAVLFYQSKEAIARFPSSARIYLKADGSPYRSGEVLVQRDLARSLRRVAQGGADEFYRGELGKTIASVWARDGGLYTAAELSAHQADLYEDPLSVSYRGLRVHEPKLPSQGIMLLEMLNVLGGFDLAALGPGVEATHLMVEAKKLTFADRNAHLGDPRFVDAPVERLLSPEHAEALRGRIDPARAAEVAMAPSTGSDTHTSSFVVVDAGGNAVSFIHSNSNVFGSGYVVEGTGILLNNRIGRGFTLQPGHPNVIAPGKRTMHTLTCFLLTDERGRLRLAGGTPGGDSQTQTGLQVLANILDFGMNVQEAIEMPRWASVPGTDPASMSRPVQVLVEPEMPASLVRGLAAKGHVVVPHRDPVVPGNFQVIAVDPETGVRTAASDPRGDGHAAAY
ncbi:MAG: gamma-glutamyltransferase [Chloroflexi bacterium]|nr:gamma-glutamyltransferase [Chloroflexota bacterium]